MKLSIADKLALMLTSAGSQRRLAAYIGASHQQVGRWVKGARVNEETGNVTNEPRDALIRANIENAFKQYRTAVYAQSRHDRIAYAKDAPVNFYRLPGAPGLRVVAENTGALRQEVFDTAIRQHVESGQYYEISVRSIVNLQAYFDRGEEKYKAQRDRGGEVAERMKIHRASLEKRLNDGKNLLPIWTRRENTMNVSTETTLSHLHKKLREKHEPATSLPGTVFADQIMLTQLPPNYVQSPAKRTKKKSQVTASRKNIRGAGPK